MLVIEFAANVHKNLDLQAHLHKKHQFFAHIFLFSRCSGERSSESRNKLSVIFILSHKLCGCALQQMPCFTSRCQYLPIRAPCTYHFTHSAHKMTSTQRLLFHAECPFFYNNLSLQQLHRFKRKYEKQGLIIIIFKNPV